MFENNNGTGTTMLVQPSGFGGYGYGNGFGDFGGGLGWLVLLALCFGGFGGFGGGYGMNGMGLYPWLNQADITTQGFANQANNMAIAGVQSAVTNGNADTQLAIAGLSQQVCNTGGNIVQTLLSNQLADIQQDYNNQLNTLQSFNGLQSQLAQCCCENRLATQGVQNAIVQDGGLTRNAIASGIQTISDKLCQLELDYYKNDNDKLRTQVNSLQANNYIQNAITAQTQFFLDRYPAPAAAATTNG